MGWLSNAASFVGNAIGDAVSTVATGAAQLTTAIVSHAAEAVVDVAYNHTTRHLINAATGAELEAVSVQRDIEVFGQGVTRGIASGIGIVGDLAVDVGYNWTTRHLIGTDSVDTNFSDAMAESVMWTEARNDREAAIMTAGQVTGEIGAFIGVTALTMGAGGAAIGGSLAAGRAAAVGTARFMSPFASRTALAVEGGFGAFRGYDIYTTDRRAAEMEENYLDQGLDGMTEAFENEQEMLRQSLDGMSEELAGIATELEDTSLSADRRQELLDRIDEIREGRQIIDTLGETTDMDERRQLLDRMEELNLLPETPDDHASTLRSPLLTAAEVRDVAATATPANAVADFRSSVLDALNNPQPVEVVTVDAAFTRELAA